jgi:hypothetical protein
VGDHRAGLLPTLVLDAASSPGLIPFEEMRSRLLGKNLVRRLPVGVAAGIVERTSSSPR